LTLLVFGFEQRLHSEISADFATKRAAKTPIERAIGDIRFANKKKTLEPGRPRVFRRMGEGLGGWGARHPARQDNPRNRTPFHRGS
jgi:hypothetical protein